MVQVDDIKNSLRIDHSMDDKMIQELIDTASYYVVSAIDGQAEGVIKDYKQFEWAVSLLVQHWYLNRQEASSERIPITVQSLIQQMRGAYYATH